jgi:hypothetical protein
MIKTYLTTGVPVPVLGCYSEAFMHCGHAGQLVDVELVEYRSEGLPNFYSGAVHVNGKRFTGFTTGECGIYKDEDGYYVYQEESGEVILPANKVAVLIKIPNELLHFASPVMEEPNEG